MTSTKIEPSHSKKKLLMLAGVCGSVWYISSNRCVESRCARGRIRSRSIAIGPLNARFKSE